MAGGNNSGGNIIDSESDDNENDNHVHMDDFESNPFEDLDSYLEAFDFYTHSYEVMEEEENKYKLCQRAYYIGKAYLQIELADNKTLAKKSFQHTVTAFTTVKDFLLENDPTNYSLELVDAILNIENSSIDKMIQVKIVYTSKNGNKLRYSRNIDGSLEDYTEICKDLGKYKVQNKEEEEKWNDSDQDLYDEYQNLYEYDIFDTEKDPIEKDPHHDHSDDLDFDLDSIEEYLGSSNTEAGLIRNYVRSENVDLMNTANGGSSSMNTANGGSSSSVNIDDQIRSVSYDSSLDRPVIDLSSMNIVIDDHIFIDQKDPRRYFLIKNALLNGTLESCPRDPGYYNYLAEIISHKHKMYDLHKKVGYKGFINAIRTNTYNVLNILSQA